MFGCQVSSDERTRLPDSRAGCCGGSQAFHGLSKTKLVSLLPPRHQRRLNRVLPVCRKATAVPRKRTTDIQNVETTTITASAWLQQDSLGRSLRAAGVAPGLTSGHRRPELLCPTGHVETQSLDLPFPHPELISQACGDEGSRGLLP